MTLTSIARCLDQSGRASYAPFIMTSLNLAFCIKASVPLNYDFSKARCLYQSGRTLYASFIMTSLNPLFASKRALYDPFVITSRKAHHLDQPERTLYAPFIITSH